MDWMGDTMNQTSLLIRDVSWPLVFPSKKATSCTIMPLNSFNRTVLAIFRPTTLKQRLCDRLHKYEVIKADYEHIAICDVHSIHRRCELYE